jgi:hypothetical protein
VHLHLQDDCAFFAEAHRSLGVAGQDALDNRDAVSAAARSVGCCAGTGGRATRLGNGLGFGLRGVAFCEAGIVFFVQHDLQYGRRDSGAEAANGAPVRCELCSASGA